MKMVFAAQEVTFFATVTVTSGKFLPLGALMLPMLPRYPGAEDRRLENYAQ